ARLGVGLPSDGRALAVEGGRLIATRPVYAGKAIQRVAFAKAPAMASLRPKMFAAVERSGSAAVEPLAFDYDGAGAAKVTSVEAAAGGKADLTEAEIIVSGGRGLKGPENFALIEQLAEA